MAHSSTAQSAALARACAWSRKELQDQLASIRDRQSALVLVAASLLAPGSVDLLQAEEWIGWEATNVLHQASAVASALGSAGGSLPALSPDASNNQALPPIVPVAAHAPLLALLHALGRAEARLRSTAAAPQAGLAGLAGALGVADIALASDLHDLDSRHGLRATLSADFPAVAALLDAVYALPAFATTALPSGPAVAPVGKRSREKDAVEAAAAAGAGPAAAAASASEKREKAPAADKKGAAAGPVDMLAAVQPAPGTASVALDDAGSLTAPLLSNVRDVFTAAIAAAFPAATAAAAAEGRPPVVADVTVNAVPKLVHHYQCNSALALVARFKGLPGAPANPRAAAEAIVAAVTASRSPIVARVEISGPGFINTYVSGAYLAARVAFLLCDGVRCAPPARRFTVALDYSSPNIAKEMHIGHLRSTIIGDALGRILELAGHTVHRINHVGDWGTQFGMLIAHLKDAQAAGANATHSIRDLTAFYKAAKGRFDAEPEFKARAQLEVVALQAGDPVNTALWQAMVDVSAAMFGEVYSRLGVDPRLKLVGESFYNSRIPPMIAELEAAGLLVDSAGARVMTVPGQEVPLMVRKGDGGYGYDSTDLAAIKYRLQELRADWLIYVVDMGQALHFDLVFSGAAKAGWFTPGAPGAPRVEHCGFGVVQGEDRKKFKTRSGETVRLVDVLEEARVRARAIIAARVMGAAGGEAGAAAAGAAEEAAPPAAAAAVELDAGSEHAAAVLGYGGVKYFDLRQNRTSDYVFNYDRMLSPDGDTAVYMQYAHARVTSILRKAREGGVDVSAVTSAQAAREAASPERAAASWAHPTEVLLALELCRFQEVIEEVQVDLLPHRVCEFLYKVASRMTEFHRDCPVLRADTPPAVRDHRLRLCVATLAVMRAALALFAIEGLDRI